MHGRPTISLTRAPTHPRLRGLAERLWAVGPTTLVVLVSCGDVVTDTGQACLIPEQIECMCPNDEACGASDYSPVLIMSWGGECTGRYSADTAHELEVMLRTPGGGRAEDVECSVEIQSDHVLSVHASYRRLPDRDDAVEDAVIATCDAPPLEAGEWTLEYAGVTTVFVVGDSAAEPIACATIGRS